MLGVARSPATVPASENSSPPSTYSLLPRFSDDKSDPLLPWLRSIRKALLDFQGGIHGEASVRLLEDCVRTFADDSRYRNDPRFLKVWILYGDATQDFGRVFGMLETKQIFQEHSLLYEKYTTFLVAKGNLLEAHELLKLGISRNAQPLDRLKTMHDSLLLNISKFIQNSPSAGKSGMPTCPPKEHIFTNPWESSIVNDLLKRVDTDMKKYNGYAHNTKCYSGKISLAYLQNNSRNKLIDLGGCKYHIKGCSGFGGFAQVYKAYVDCDPEDVVALKVQKPAFPWEFYMYRQLDKHFSGMERASFGYAKKIHIYSDWSILVCDYLCHGTLQDAINSYLVMQKLMEEVLCFYYTIEMLRMLEALHSVGIVHGDFKPDNLLIRYAREDLAEADFGSRTGSWKDQGLCLVDWGRGIDLSLFPAGTKFKGDSRTSGFRCIEMQEDQPWTYQVDTYGLCVAVHMMLHGQYMTVQKKLTPDGGSFYQPKAALKRYWNTELWGSLFSALLNNSSCSWQSNVETLKNLRTSFEDHFRNNPRLVADLKHLLLKQKASLCTA